MLISEIKLHGIGNFTEETVIELDSKTFFCGNQNTRNTFCRAIELLFGTTAPALSDFSANELNISAKFSFPETDSSEIPEFFHHMRADNNGGICAVLELSAEVVDGTVDVQQNWLLPHNVKRPVREYELKKIKFIHIAPEWGVLKNAFLQILPDILPIKDKITLDAFPEAAKLICNTEIFTKDCSKWLFDGIEMITPRWQLPELLKELLSLRQKLPDAADILLYIEDMPDFTPEAANIEIIHSSARISTTDFQLEQLRCFTENSVKTLTFPDNEADKISVYGGLKQFPELLSAETVIFTVSADDKIILDKFFKVSDINLSDRNIAIVPLSGRKIHLYWQILDQLGTTYFTLADLRHGKEYGDWKAIAGYLHSCAYCQKELPVEEGKSEAVNIEELAKDSPDLKNEYVWLNWLKENQHIYFAAPFDLNYLMLQSFRQEYSEIFSEYSLTDEEFYHQISTCRDFATVHTEIFSMLSDDELHKRMPEMFRTLISQIK
jgi:hypothetical protein